MHQHLYFYPQSSENWNIRTWMVLSLLDFTDTEKNLRKYILKTTGVGSLDTFGHHKTRYSRLVTPDARSRSFETDG